MKGSDLVKLGEQYPDFTFEIEYIDMHSHSISGIKKLKNLEVQRIDADAKIITLTSNVVQTIF